MCVVLKSTPPSKTSNSLVEKAELPAWTAQQVSEAEGSTEQLERPDKCQ